ncbi:MAG: molybdopterin converting factor [Candidatus Omnitrophica bacterium CG11_big_fil_rev_8_21_14_0_20_63_9]|nr:MAG: molybdopterin converting factor [Candidatus Omnitrophica bacterium CG11_big_fil_rev_8_21_14_0_20_63_9]
MKPISWNRLAYLERWAMQPSCGAFVTFAGVVRADRHEGRTVRALFYEAYAEMAERQLAYLVAETTARWSLDAVEIQHRLGLVEAGQISVVVVVRAQHRAMAYAASQFLLEGIKQRVPIWKHTHYDDGTSRSC